MFNTTFVFQLHTITSCYVQPLFKNYKIKNWVFGITLIVCDGLLLFLPRLHLYKAATLWRALYTCLPCLSAKHATIQPVGSHCSWQQPSYHTLLHFFMYSFQNAMVQYLTEKRKGKRREKRKKECSMKRTIGHASKSFLVLLCKQRIECASPTVRYIICSFTVAGGNHFLYCSCYKFKKI